MKAMNSAPISKNRPAALKKARIRNSTEWTGLRAEMTITPAAMATKEKP
jgi:DNA topoisomerase VI subunit B